MVSSDNSYSEVHQSVQTCGVEVEREHTVNAFPVALLLLIEKSVFVLGQHFLLARHLRKPPSHSLGSLAIALKCGTHGVNDPVHGAQALALSCLLGGG